jgi:RNA polymerase sigma factor (sigma-70 family)
MKRFESFYFREFRSVVGLVYALSGSRLAAEDVAQEAFMAAYRNWDRLATYDRPDAWVRRVAIRLQGRVAKRRMLEVRALVRSALSRDHVVEVAEVSAEVAELWQAVRRLPKRQAQVLTLYYQAGYRIAEIAATLELAEGTVKAHLHHGRRALADRLGRSTRQGVV